jgi:hypothetical protein
MYHVQTHSSVQPCKPLPVAVRCESCASTRLNATFYKTTSALSALLKKFPGSVLRPKWPPRLPPPRRLLASDCPPPTRLTPPPLSRPRLAPPAAAHASPSAAYYHPPLLASLHLPPPRLAPLRPHLAPPHPPSLRSLSMCIVFTPLRSCACTRGSRPRRSTPLTFVGCAGWRRRTP